MFLSRRILPAEQGVDHELASGSDDNEDGDEGEEDEDADVNVRFTPPSGINTAYSTRTIHWTSHI